MRPVFAMMLCAVVGLAGCLAVVLAAFAAPRLAFAAWLAAVLAVAMVPVGVLPLLLVWHLHRGAWGRTMRPAMEAAVATMPVAALLMLPVLLFAGWFYPWDAMGGAHHGAWLDPGLFLVRGIVYFALWWLVAHLAVRRTTTGRKATGSGGLASAGLIVYALTASLAGIDWVLSLQPDVISSIFGLVFINHQMLGAFAFLILASLAAMRSGPATPRGIGNMLLGGVMLWVYHEYMQYLVAWSGDLPHHTKFYLERTGDAWDPLIYVMAIGGGALPFVALLSSRVRSDAAMLAWLAGWLLAVRAMEAAWWVLPLEHRGLGGALLFLAALAGAGGLWAAAWLFAVARRPARAERAEGEQVAHG